MCGLEDEILEDWNLISHAQNEWTDDTAELAIKLMIRAEIIDYSEEETRGSASLSPNPVARSFKQLHGKRRE